MNDIEKVIKDLESIKELGTDGSPAHIKIDNAIQTIEELQSNQCHLNSPCEYQNEDIEIKEVCEWKLFDENANAYNTTCGGAFWFNDGNPKDNGFKYCPYCNRKIKVVERWQIV